MAHSQWARFVRPPSSLWTWKVEQCLWCPGHRNTISMRAPRHITHTPRETLASTPKCLFLGRQRSHGCRLHRPGPRTPQETVHPRTASSQAVSSLPQEQQDLPHPSGLHLLSLSFLVLLLLPRSWERQAPLSSLHLCSDHVDPYTVYTHICTHTALPAPAPLSVWYFPPFSRIDQLYLLPPGWKIKSRGFIPCEPQTTVATQYLIYAIVQSLVTWCLPRRLYLQVSWRRGGLGRGAGEKLQGTESSPRVCPKDALTAHSVAYRKGGVSRSPRPGGAVELLTVDLTGGNQN